MNYRIIRIPGRNAASREARLAAAKEWMASQGWTLVDYGEESRRALFEPAKDQAGGATRRVLPWQFPPGYWPGLREEWLTRRNSVAAGVAVTALGALFAINAQQNRFDPERAAQAVGERWWVANADALNVREEPVTGAPVVGMLQRGQRVLIGESRDGWIEIVHPSRGWVAAKFLTPPGDSPER